MQFEYYANGKKTGIQEYLEVMMAARGDYKQDVVLYGDKTIHILTANVPNPLRVA